MSDLVSSEHSSREGGEGKDREAGRDRGQEGQRGGREVQKKRGKERLGDSLGHNVGAAEAFGSEGEAEVSHLTRL